MGDNCATNWSWQAINGRRWVNMTLLVAPVVETKAGCVFFKLPTRDNRILMMDDKWIEVTVLAATNVLTLIIVALLNIVASYCTRYEDSEHHHRKYTVAPRAQVSSSRKHIAVGPKHSSSSPTGSNSSAGSTDIKSHAKEPSSKPHGGSAQKKHS